jgi:hypothetical protein
MFEGKQLITLVYVTYSNCAVVCYSLDADGHD